MTHWGLRLGHPEPRDPQTPPMQFFFLSGRPPGEAGVSISDQSGLSVPEGDGGPGAGAGAFISQTKDTFRLDCFFCFFSRLDWMKPRKRLDFLDSRGRERRVARFSGNSCILNGANLRRFNERRGWGGRAGEGGATFYQPLVYRKRICHTLFFMKRGKKKKKLCPTHNTPSPPPPPPSRLLGVRRRGRRGFGSGGSQGHNGTRNK